jgi:hypothetical protein
VAPEPNKVRAFALDITVDNPAKINTIDYNDPNYWVYPGSIEIVNGEVNDVGSPVASPTFPGTLGGLDTNGITIEMGSLYYPTGDNSPNAPPNSGKLLKFRVSKDCTVTVAENAIRGGVVLTNPSLDPTVTLTGCTVVCAQVVDCFPSTYTTFNDWKTLNKPNCWCGIYWAQDPDPLKKWRFQCDGDADGATDGAVKNRVYLADLNLLIANWKKKIADPTLNPCADIDHKPEGAVKNRVYLADLNIVIANWKKKDAGLPGNCPRAE